MKYLQNAVEFLSSLGFKFEEFLVDSQESPYAAVMIDEKGRGYYTVAAEYFHLVLGRGASKSIDKETVDRAIVDGKGFILYVQDPRRQGGNGDPQAYAIEPRSVRAFYSRDTDLEKFGLGETEQRMKYSNVSMNNVGAENIRTWRHRKLYPGENFWLEQFQKAGLSVLYTGDRLGDPVFDALHFTPDFIVPGRAIIIEEGEHTKEEQDRRKYFAREYGVMLYLIPKGADFYRHFPYAVKEIIDELRALISTPK